MQKEFLYLKCIRNSFLLFNDITRHILFIKGDNKFKIYYDLIKLNKTNLMVLQSIQFPE